MLGIKLPPNFDKPPVNCQEFKQHGSEVPRICVDKYIRNPYAGYLKLAEDVYFSPLPIDSSNSGDFKKLIEVVEPIRRGYVLKGQLEIKTPHQPPCIEPAKVKVIEKTGIARFIDRLQTKDKSPWCKVEYI